MRDEGDGGQDDKHSSKRTGDEKSHVGYSCPIPHPQYSTKGKIVVSSAKRTVQSGGRTLGKSLIKSENRVGQELIPVGSLQILV